MLDRADLDDASPLELVSLARLASDPRIAPPPYLRGDLVAKGWLVEDAAGLHQLTDAGRRLLEREESPPNPIAWIGQLAMLPAWRSTTT